MEALALPTQQKDSGSSSFEDRAKALMSISREEGVDHEEAPSRETATRHDIACAIRAQGVPERIISVFIEPDGPKLTDATKAVVKFLTAPREAWCLVLAGNPGTGKSTAAAHYLWVTADTTKTGPSTAQRWWTAHEVSRVSQYHQSGVESGLEKLMRIPVLVIDDLGVEYLDKNGFFSSRFDEIMDSRYNNFRKTIITTNLNSEDFQKRYGKRVTTRIRHGFKAGGDFIQIEAGSMRL